MARTRQTKRTDPVMAPPRRAPLIAVAVAALVAFVALALGDIVTSSPTSDEPPHLVAGYSYWTARDYRLNPEHPPLLKSFAALPLLAMNVWPAHWREAADGQASFRAFREAWSMTVSNPTSAEWAVAQFMLYGLRDAALQRVHGDAMQPPGDAAYTHADFLNDSRRMFVAARVMMLLIAVALAATIFWWSYSVWGLPGGVVSLLLFCLDPNFIAHAGLVTTDVGAAFLICAASYFFWRACTLFDARNVTLFALTFALAQIAKFSAVLLIPMLLVMAVVEIIRTKRVLPAAVSLAVAAAATIFVIWAAYGFRYSTVPDPAAAIADEQATRAHPQMPGLIRADLWPTGSLPVRDAVETWYAEKRLRSEMPNGYTDADFRQAKRSTPIGIVGSAVLFMADHHLLPESFLFGFAWTGVSSVSRTAYLRGEYSNYGFAGYFFWTILWKLPIPLLILTLLGLLLALGRLTRADVLFLAIPLAVYALFAFTTAINIGHRHIFPVFPFVYVMAGALGTYWSALVPRTRSIAAAVSVALLAITANVALLPQPASLINRHLSYLNEFAGGPISGWDKLSDSNFDWGQDVGRLAEWLRAHHVTEPIAWVVFGNTDPRYYGIRFVDYRSTTVLPQHPTYAAVSQMGYLGMIFDAEHRRLWSDYLSRVNAKRVGTAGYSIFIYKID